MKQENTGTRRRIRTAAAICALLIIGGGTAGILAHRSRTDPQVETVAAETQKPAASSGSQGISAGGTVTSALLSDEFGLVNTAARLTVEAVLAEAGDTVAAGTALYQITADSLAKAEKTLNSELQSAENDLLRQKITYTEEQNEAYALYESERTLGETASQTYSAGIADLDSALQQAYDEYTAAQNTVSSTPSQITAKQNALDRKQSAADKLQKELETAEKSLSNAQTAYAAAADSYNSLAAEYNAAAGAVQYLGNAAGKDVSGVKLAQTVSAQIQPQSGSKSETAEPNSAGSFPGGFDGKGGMNGTKPDQDSFSIPVQRKPEATVPDSAAQDDTAADAAVLYADASKKYEAKKKALSNAEAAFKKAESTYSSCQKTVTEKSTALKEAQSSVSALEQEISALNSTLSKAQSNLGKLRETYNSLKASYDTDQLELQHTLDTDTASGENADYHYQITCATIEEALAEKQSAYDTAKENLRLFTETLADGYVYAAQDGIVSSLSFQEGRNFSFSTPYVYYVDESSYSVTAELDQNDVTQVSIGDSVLIYSSETGIANGKITAIAAGTSTSLADVRFNVTVTADEGANLYSGESVNIYFNAGSMKQSDFADYRGKQDADGGETAQQGTRGSRPDFSGGMPEGFDPSNMPAFGGSRREN